MGYTHIYCGDGKGKTSAAVGLAIRAAGRNKRVRIARFLKTDDSGEVFILKKLPGITILPCVKTFGFYNQMSEEMKAEAVQYYTGLLHTALEGAVKDHTDLLILDEIIAACNYHLAPEEELVQFLKTRPDSMEVVLTGRSPSPALSGLADYISEIKKVRHPYDCGTTAREGIEY